MKRLMPFFQSGDVKLSSIPALTLARRQLIALTLRVLRALRGDPVFAIRIY
jgi:hypothetical protein